VVTWLSASKVMRNCKGASDMKWLRDLMAMTQVSLVAYLTAGAFLGLAYFDYFYNLVLIVAVAKGITTTHARTTVATALPPADALANRRMHELTARARMYGGDVAPQAPANSSERVDR